jgi:hypothetical protein
MVGRIGFEPMKAQGQLIYSQPRLTTSLPALWSRLSDLDRRPAVYKTAALPLS